MATTELDRVKLEMLIDAGTDAWTALLSMEEGLLVNPDRVKAAVRKTVDSILDELDPRGEGVDVDGFLEAFEERVQHLHGEVERLDPPVIVATRRND